MYYVMLGLSRGLGRVSVSVLLGGGGGVGRGGGHKRPEDRPEGAEKGRKAEKGQNKLETSFWGTSFGEQALGGRLGEQALGGSNIFTNILGGIFGRGGGL